jgi:flap endonuclease-1
MARNSLTVVKMGVNLGKIVKPEKIDISKLSGKTLALDAHNHLYQFLTAIRTREGDLITDSDENVISHLLGLFPRTVNLMKNHIKVVYVFDGKFPELKEQTITKRKESKKKAKELYKKAKEKENIEEMRKYAVRTSRLTDQIINDSKELIRLLGLPVIEAPYEAEAQAAFMVQKEDAYAVSSNDYDTLLHGTKKLIRKLSKSNRKLEPEIVVLDSLLENLRIDRDKLIALAMMIGTDYNPQGIKGIGFNRGLKLLRNNSVEEIFQKLDPDFDWKRIMDLFKNMEVVEDYEIEWVHPDKEKIRELLIEKHNFSEDRVNKKLKELDDK